MTAVTTPVALDPSGPPPQGFSWTSRGPSARLRCGLCGITSPHRKHLASGGLAGWVEGHATHPYECPCGYRAAKRAGLTMHGYGCPEQPTPTPRRGAQVSQGPALEASSGACHQCGAADPGADVRLTPGRVDRRRVPTCGPCRWLSGLSDGAPSWWVWSPTP